MSNEDIYKIISNYMHPTLSHASSRFLHTKKENLLENTVDISKYRETSKLSYDLYCFSDLYKMDSINDIQFRFENEILLMPYFL